MNTVLLCVLALAGMGLVFGAGLSVAGTVFKVNEDPKLAAIKEALPGANCGGCGYAGCAALAEAVLKGDAPPDACPVGGAAAAIAVGRVLGVNVTLKERQCAFVRCGGGSSRAVFRYEYQGMNDCGAAMQLAAGGAKACVYGCLGGGSCRSVCEFGAISMRDGIAVVDNDRCTACGRCVKACPKNIIVMVPHSATPRVACHSCDNGKDVRARCSVGCIGCRMCARTCEHGAVQVENFLSAIDPSKCTRCGACAEKCPMKCIVAYGTERGLT